MKAVHINCSLQASTEKTTNVDPSRMNFIILEIGWSIFASRCRSLLLDLCWLKISEIYQCGARINGLYQNE